MAIISDIHGNVCALEAVLSDIKTRAVSAVVNLGDCVTSPLWPKEALELLQEHNFPTVRGNHDREIGGDYSRLIPSAQFAYAALSSEQRHALSTLPPMLQVTQEILAVHGTPSDDSTYLLEEIIDGRLVPAKRETITDRLGVVKTGVEIVLCGHSHNQGFRQIPNGPLVLNPGSVGCPVMADRPTARTLEYRSPHARYSILTRNNGRWGAEMVALEYDWRSASQKALANGRSDWAQAMATGTVS